MKFRSTCFDYNLVIFRPILTIVLPDVMHTFESHRVYMRGNPSCQFLGTMYSGFFPSALRCCIS